MSAEVETNPEEEIKDVKKQVIKIKKSMRSHIEIGLLVVKILELFICIICTVLIYEPIHASNLGRMYTHHVGVMYTAFTGYIVILGVTLLSRAIGDIIPYRTASLFAVIGSALFLVAGILLIMHKPMLKQQYFPPQGHLMTMVLFAVTFSFLNVVLFAADATFSFVMYLS